MARSRCAPALLAFCLGALPARAATYPAPVEAEFVARDFRFDSGETLKELRLHYRTLGSPRRDAQGHVSNAVLILHGTSGAGTQFLAESFAGVLFGPGQPLDATRHFIILMDGIWGGELERLLGETAR